MYRPRDRQAAERRGIVLLVVLALLTLFAIVGISFVLYANSEANASRYFREGEAPPQPDMDPEQLLAYFLNQAIYDVDDERPGAANPNVYSALRGHSLARSMYGYNDSDGIPNTTAFNGTGRLRVTTPFPGGSLLRIGPNNEPINEYHCINYIPFSNETVRHDPERPGFRANGAARNPFIGGYNAPYTYPDLNNMFLAAVQASNNAVLIPSFHRPWLFGPLVGPNPNWTNREGKWLLLRPREFDMRLNPGTQCDFPYPEDAGGDVKNLVTSPGYYYKDPAGNWGFANNDSVWLDLGAPVMIAPDGTKFKALFAPLVLDLDNRVNLNVHGNMAGRVQDVGGPRLSHASNQGWGPWEVDISKVLSLGGSPIEWTQMFSGNQTIGEPGRYTYDPNPHTSFPPTNEAAPGTAPHYYGMVDFDGRKETFNSTPSDRLIFKLSVQNSGPNFFFPYSPARPDGYGDGSVLERRNHPLIYNFFNPQQSGLNPSLRDLAFPISNMEALLRYGETNSPGLTSSLYRLCPKNFDGAQNPAAAKERWLVTTHSFDVGRAGLSPWAWNPNPNAPTSLQMNAIGERPLSGLTDLPTAQPIALQAFTPPARPVPPFQGDPTNNLLRAEGDFQPDWRAVNAALTKIDLNRELTPYPIRKANPAAPFHPYTNPSLPYTGAEIAQYNTATGERQQFALDIYMRLVVATGAYNPYYNTTTPTKEQLVALRWLAQLAVNIVDFVDSDDIMTPFEWTAKGNTNFTNTVRTAFPAEFPLTNKYVFGTELPRVVINEVYAESTRLRSSDHQYEVDFWVELYNPMFRTGDPLLGDPIGTIPPTMTGDTESADPNRGYAFLHLPGAAASSYKLTIVKPDPTQDPSPDYYMRESQNVYGLPRPGRIMTSSTGVPCEIKDFLAGPDPNHQRVIEPSGGAFDVPMAPPTQNRGFYVIGPNKDFPKDPGGMMPGARYPIATIQRPQLTGKADYTIGGTGITPNDGRVKPTILLQRLACPYLPETVDNPYVTVDYVEHVEVNAAREYDNGMMQMVDTDVNMRHSYGRVQPFWGNDAMLSQNPDDPGGSDLKNQPKHTFFRQNAKTNDPTKFATTYTDTQLSPVPFNWLPHLDRQLISPMEILNVSAFRPHELLKQFHNSGYNFNGTYGGTITNGLYGHLAPWYDQRTRLYRVFEFLETHDRAAGVARGARIPGKVNINTIWDEETFQALCAALPPPSPTGDPPSPNDFRTTDVTAIFQNFLKLRHRAWSGPVPPAYVPGQNDRPFLGMAAGHTIGAPGDNVQHPFGGTGINDTFLRALPSSPTDNPDSAPDGGGAGATLRKRLFQINQPPDNANAIHPYLQNELMTKIFNHITTRSNVFAVWVTVGFFKVTDENARPVKLGAEIGKAENRNIRHRMFAIVDRSNLATGEDPTRPPQPPILLAGHVIRDNNPGPMKIAIAGATYTGGASPKLSGYYEGYPWTIEVGRTLTIGHGLELRGSTGIGTSTRQLLTENASVSTVNAPVGTAQPAYVTLQSPIVNATNDPFIIMPYLGPVSNQIPPPVLGNPGPKPRFDPRKYPWVVRYFSIIQ